MTFRAIRLDPCISEGAQGGPQFRTDLAESESGDESREGTISKGLGRWTISYSGRRPVWWERFLDHFYIVGGMRDTFPFKDWLDFECETSDSHLEPIDGDSPADTWQMYKRRTISSLTYDQKIVLPVAGAITVVGSGTYTVSSTTGIITKTAGANPTGFSCEFDKLVRFDSDHLVQTLEVRQNNADRTIIVSYAGVALIEVPLTSA